MEKDIKYHHATKEDLDAIEKLLHGTIEEEYGRCYPAEVVKYFIKYHGKNVILDRLKNSYNLVAKRSQEIVGYGYIKEKYIGGVYIHPRFHRMGIGKAIVYKLIEHARNNKTPTVVLDASLPSKKFYNKLGFETVEEKVMYVEHNAPLLYWVMKKDIH